MRRITSYLILTLVALSTLQAQTSVWKVEGNKNTIYLAGTIHLLREQDYPLPEEFEIAYNASETIVFEADIDMSDPDASTSMMEKLQPFLLKAMFQDERTLESVLSKETYEKLSKDCADLGLPMASFSKFKPAFVFMMIENVKMIKESSVTAGVDVYFMNKIKEDKKRIASFETLEQQMEMLVNTFDGLEEEYISQLTKMNDKLPEMISAWRLSDQKWFDEQIEEMKELSEEVYDKLLKDRNNAWMPKILTYLEDEPVECVMVGALHMHGEDGILKQLSEKDI